MDEPSLSSARPAPGDPQGERLETRYGCCRSAGAGTPPDHSEKRGQQFLLVARWHAVRLRQLEWIERQGKSPSDVRHYKHAGYKFNDTGWFDDKRAHLWWSNIASGAAKQLTVGEDWKTAIRSGRLTAKKIAFVPIERARNSTRAGTGTSGSSMPQEDRWPIILIRRPDISPRWSPTGKTIASSTRLSPGTSEDLACVRQGGAAPRLAIDGLESDSFGLRWQTMAGLYFESGIKAQVICFRADLEARRARRSPPANATIHLVHINAKTAASCLCPERSDPHG